MRKTKISPKDCLCNRFLFFGASIALILFVFQFFLPSSDLNEDASADAEYSMSVSTSSTSVDLNLETSTEGTIEVAKNSVIATTNSPDGYKLFLSAEEGQDNAIHLDGDEENNTTAKKIFATAGTFAEPAPLSVDTNSSWGYGVPGLENFNKAYNVTSKDGLKFAAVPLAEEKQLIHECIGEATNDVTDVYYGVKVNQSVGTGTYSKNVVYTAISNSPATIIGRATVNPTFIYDMGDSRRIEIKTKLNVTRDINKLYAMVDNKSCENVNVETTSPLIISCEVDETLPVGKYDVSLNIPAVGKEYFIPKGFQIKHLYAMQDMTPELCNQLEEQELFMDDRDGKKYKVEKEADGKCWMKEDLKFALDETMPLTKESTDLNTVETWTPTASTSTRASSWKTNQMSSYDPGDNEGIFYNFAAATTSTVVSRRDEYMNMPNSICPKGWRLPVVSMFPPNASEITFATSNEGSQFHATEYLTSSLHDSSLNFSDGYMIRCVARGESKTLSYYAPGANNVPASDTDDLEDRLLSLQAPTMSGKVFKGWSYTSGATTPDISYNGVSFSTDKVHITGDTTLYSVWVNLKTLSFYAPGAGNVPASITNESGTFVIPNVTPTKTSYRFMGWSRTNGGGVEFGIGATITIGANTTLYAVWQPLSLNEIEYMHEMTSGVCSGTNLRTSKQLKDIRDGKLYWVTKLPDGRCWMTQNLDLNLGGTLTSDTTDLNTISAVSTRGTVGSLGSWGMDGWSSYDPGNYYYDGFSGALDSHCESISGCPQNFSTSVQFNGHTHVGNYYGWLAATATPVGGAAVVDGAANASNSICPKGWKLPSAGEWASLMAHYTEPTFLRDPVYITRTGSIWGTSNLRYAKFDVFYWTSTKFDGGAAYAVYAYHKWDNDRTEYTAYGHHSFQYGKTVRCVAR